MAKMVALWLRTLPRMPCKSNLLRPIGMQFYLCENGNMDTKKVFSIYSFLSNPQKR